MLFGFAVLWASVPFGYLAAGQVCFLMGFANVPGYRLWSRGAEQQHAVTQWLGILLGWLGQSVVSLSFAFVLVKMVHLIFSRFEWPALVRWVYWFAVFLLALGPAYKSLGASEQSSSEVEKVFYRTTLLLTCLVTGVGFLIFAVK